MILTTGWFGAALATQLMAPRHSQSEPHFGKELVCSIDSAMVAQASAAADLCALPGACGEWTARSGCPTTNRSTTAERERSRRWRQLQHWILREEIEWAQDEVVPHDRHDWPVFRARRMVEAERVPRHDVRVLDGAIGFGPGGDAIVSLAFSGIDAGGEALVSFIRRDPELVR